MTEPRGAWARPRPSTSRTPQSRSSNASPAPTTDPTNAPAKPAASVASAAAVAPATAPAPAPTANFWAERANRTAAQKSGGGAPKEAAVAAKVQESPAAAAAVQKSGVQHVPVNGFNAGEVREFLQRGPKVAPYKVAADGGVSKTGGVKGSDTANGESFFAQLSKQVAALQPE